MRHLAKEREIDSLVLRAQSAQIVRIFVGVRAILVGARKVGANRPAIDPAQRGTRSRGIEPQLLIENGTFTAKVAEALVGGRGPVVVVAVDRFCPGSSLSPS